MFVGTRGSLLKLWARPLAVISALLLCASALSARAGALEPLSQDDVRYYRAAFAATDRGDFDAAKAAFANIHDRELGGRLAFARIMHPTAYAASYQDLTAWLKAYGNEAGE